ncbi:hypothetical protein EMIT0P260_10132 [Pseudomonas sp. IT-P260]
MLVGLSVLEGRLSVRSGQRGQFCHDRPRLDFSSQLVNQLCVRVLIDCGTQDLLGAADSQQAHLGAQLVFDTVQFLFDLGLSLNLHTVSVDTGFFNSLFNDLVAAFLGLLDDFSCLSFRFAQLLTRFLLGQLQVASCSAGSVQTISDLLLTFVQCRNDRRPYELHAEQYKNQERNGLANQGRINVHANTSQLRCPSHQITRKNPGN